MRKTTIALGLFAALLTVPAFATTLPAGTLTVSATVSNSCAFTAQSGGGAASNAALNFGDVTATLLTTGAQMTTSGTANGMGIQCTKNTKYNVYLSKTSGTMLGAANGGSLPYNLYQGGYTTAWPTTAGTAIQFTATGAVDPIDFYGKIPAQTALPPADSYSDTVVVNVSY